SITRDPAGTRRFLDQTCAAHPAAPRIEDAMDTVELKVAPDAQPSRQRLRLRSFYTGTTYWMNGWDGSEEGALVFIDEAADLQGSNVGGDRRHGPVLWDEIPRR